MFKQFELCRQLLPRKSQILQPSSFRRLIRRQFHPSVRLLDQKKNHYETLGVPKDADEKQIKQAFFKAAKKHHPDANPDDPNASEKFTEVNEAYQTLSNKNKRAEYDMFGSASGAAGGHPGFGGDGFEGMNVQDRARHQQHSYYYEYSDPHNFYEYSDAWDRGEFDEFEDFDPFYQFYSDKKSNKKKNKRKNKQNRREEFLREAFMRGNASHMADEDEFTEFCYGEEIYGEFPHGKDNPFWQFTDFPENFWDEGHGAEEFIFVDERGQQQSPNSRKQRKKDKQASNRRKQKQEKDFRERENEESDSEDEEEFYEKDFYHTKQRQKNKEKKPNREEKQEDKRKEKLRQEAETFFKYDANHFYDAKQKEKFGDWNDQSNFKNKKNKEKQNNTQHKHQKASNHDSNQTSQEEFNFHSNKKKEDVFTDENGQQIIRGHIVYNKKKSKLKKHDREVEIDINFDDCLKEVKRDIRVNVEQKCGGCQGSGAKPGTSPVKCLHCQGSGMMQRQQGFMIMQTTCPYCHGEGVSITPCNTCDGQGLVNEKKTVAVSIPAGVEDNMRVRIPHQGGASRSKGQRGHVYLLCHVKPSRMFERIGSDLHIKMNVPLSMALLGGELEIKLPGQRSLKHNVKSGTQSGHIDTVRGKGFPDPRNGMNGHLYIHISVHIPTGLDEESKKLVEEFKKLELFKEPTSEKPDLSNERRKEGKQRYGFGSY